MAAPLPECDCSDFMKFQEGLNKLRKIDDRVIYSLNQSVPTQSFANVDATSRCKGLHQQIVEAHSARQNAIKKCLNEVSKNIERLQEQRKSDPENTDISKTLRKEQTKLRLMKSEVSVEEVVNDRTLKAYDDKCGKAYKVPITPIL